MHRIGWRRLCARSYARVASFSFMTAALVGSASAQQATTPAQLSLEEAVALARRNNPDFMAQKNDAALADWAVREAYGSLLPGASASASFGR